MNHKDDILQSLRLTGRKNVELLIDFLKNSSDFFTAPSSTMFHCNHEGGLAEHSWNVFDLLVKKNEQFMFQYPYDMLAITGLLHDLCKVNYYKVDERLPTDPQLYRLKKEIATHKHPMPEKITFKYASELIDWYINSTKILEARPKFKETYIVDDQFPLGHGEKSVILAQKYIQLEEEEILAIRWHMSSFDAGIHFNYPSGYPFREAINKSPLVTILITSDIEASNLLEMKI